MSNLPVPKQNEVYYWEAKIYDKPDNTLISIGMATKPYPLFRLPGSSSDASIWNLETHADINQVSINTQWRIFLTGLADTTSPLTRHHMDPMLCKATLLV